QSASFPTTPSDGASQGSKRVSCGMRRTRRSSAPLSLTSTRTATCTARRAQGVGSGSRDALPGSSHLPSPLGGSHVKDALILACHARPAHHTTAGVGDLSDVDSASNRGVAMAKEEGDLVNALTREEGGAGDAVAEGMHRGNGAARNRHSAPSV